MHASIEQLSAIKDGIESPLDEHVESCEQCKTELARLSAIGNSLFATHDHAPEESAWDKILEASDLGGDSESGGQESQPRAVDNVHVLSAAPPSNSINRAIYTLAASLVFIGLITLFTVSQQNNSTRLQTDQMQASINQLMSNSQGLENVLQQVMVKNDRLSVQDRASAERLYSKLSYVDQELHEANPDEPEDNERIQILWSDRVEVLNELNRLFYQRKDALTSAEYLR